MDYLTVSQYNVFLLFMWLRNLAIKIHKFRFLLTLF